MTDIMMHHRFFMMQWFYDGTSNVLREGQIHQLWYLYTDMHMMTSKCGPSQILYHSNLAWHYALTEVLQNQNFWWF